MRTKYRSDDGITLIELLVTIVLVGLIAAMTVPRFQVAWERIKVGSTDRNLVSLLRLARSMAVSGKDLYGVYCNGDNLTVSLFKDVVNPGLSQFDPGDSVIKVDTLPGEFNYLGTDMTNDVIVFQPNGSATFVGGGNITSMAVTENIVGILTHNILASTGRIHSSSSYY